MQLQTLLTTTQTKSTPFLRWAGGKSWFIKYLPQFTPALYNDYHEIFLGGGAVFFNTTRAESIYLSDLNTDLIETYIQVRDNIDAVIDELKKFKNEKDIYYKVRGDKYTDSNLKAAQFIYLNKTSFNGIYRVNQNGGYNVPYGFRTTKDFIEESVLRNASNKLQSVNIKSQDFESALSTVKKGDFVFLDPPYTVAHENNGFIAYNQKLFTLEDQYRLCNCLKELNNIGAHFVLTNAYHEKIKEIYTGVGEFNILNRRSLIGGKGAKREIIKEYAIKNF
jgi:DNA adenine methylase